MSYVTSSLWPRTARIAVVAASVVSAMALVGCGSTEPKVPPKDVVPATITPTSTGTLAGKVGTQLPTPIGVVVENKAGEPIDSAVVTFAVASGNGTLANTSVRTDATGTATTTWTLGSTAGTQTVTATVGTLAPVTFTATAAAASASALVIVAGNNQSAVAGTAVTTPPSVKVTDQFGNPVSGVLVTFNVASGGGSVTPSAANTDANGTATVSSWRLGAGVGPNTLTATAAGVSSPVTFTATGTVGAAASVQITNTAPTLTIGQKFTLTAQAFDANNNQIPNAPITWSSSTPSIATVDATTGAVTGVASGSATITATAGAATATQVVNVIGHPGATVAAKIPMQSRISNVVTAGNAAYAALSTAGSVAAIDFTTDTTAWTLVLGGSVKDVAVNRANTIVTAAVSNGASNWLYIIDPATHAAVDSVALTGAPVRMVMNSTGSKAYVDENNFSVEVVDIPSRSVTGTISVAGTATAMKMAAGDSLFYVGTALGTVYEVSTTAGTVRRQFQPSSTVVDMSVSTDGKTLVVADGTSTVTFIPLASGGLSGTLDFGKAVSGVAFAPDFSQLWVTMGDIVYAAPFQNGAFNPNIVAGRTQVQGTLLSRIAISSLGNVAVVIDDAGNQVVVFK